MAETQGRSGWAGSRCLERVDMHSYCPEVVTNVSVCVPEFPSASLRGGGPRAQKLGLPRQTTQSVCVPEFPLATLRGGGPQPQKMGFPRQLCLKNLQPLRSFNFFASRFLSARSAVF